MTLFEYLSVAVSIVLSLSAAQILASVRSVLQGGKRYWVHVIWIVLALNTHVILWWEFWAYRDVTDWTLAKFLLVLVNPGLLFVASNALATSNMNTNTSWEEHFFAARWSFFVPFGVLLVVSFFRDAFILDRPFEVARHLPELIVLGVCPLGASSESRRTHAILALVALFTIVVGSASLWTQPGGGSQL